MSVLYFLVLVGVLVVIHELGHFVAAKILDVKVLRFSIGYGRPLVRFKGAETEYQLAIFPLGGYVRILGVEDGEEDDPRDRGRSFHNRPLWQRLLILFAGPAANLILPIFIFFGLHFGQRERPAAVVGDVFEDSPAARAGIAAGDRVLGVDDTNVRYWEELEHAIQKRAGKEVHLHLEREGGPPFWKYVTPVEETVRKRDGTSRRQGRIGITRAPFVPMVGIIDSDSPAAKAGMRTGDLIISIDGEETPNWSAVVRGLGHGARRTNVVYFRGTEVPGISQVRLLDARFADLVPETRIGDDLTRTAYTGLENAEMFVAHVDPGTPADRAGLQVGDLITTLDGQPVKHWSVFDQRLLSDPERTWTVGWRRTQDGKVVDLSAKLTQVRRKDRDEYGHTTERLVLGARNDVERGQGRMVPISDPFAYAFSEAVADTSEAIAIMANGLFKVLGGDSPSESLGGPLTMFRVASVSGEQGLDSFLRLMALISVNLGLINLFPVPVLDGGHVLIFAVEAVRRKPLTSKTRERIQSAGLAFIVLITLLALRNDVMRYLVR
ncbi:MAG TPA: RIP metalloprotease RseP [Kofleriaceae bacterium]|nr:RIP metalloprotease RseP [Kofleriaceae bacterium]